MLILSLILLLFSSTTPSSESYVLDRDNSILAVVTHKAGVASRFAHNHLISAASYEASLSGSPDSIQALSFQFSAPVDSLLVDDPVTIDRWGARIAELGIEDRLGARSSGDRRKIRKTMLGDGQMDARQFPNIRAATAQISTSVDPGWCRATAATAIVDFEIKGGMQSIDFDLCIHSTSDSVLVEAIGESSFSSLGIRPYSGFLGTVKNRDEIHFYSKLAFTVERIE